MKTCKEMKTKKQITDWLNYTITELNAKTNERDNAKSNYHFELVHEDIQRLTAIKDTLECVLKN